MTRQFRYGHSAGHNGGQAVPGTTTHEIWFNDIQSWTGMTVKAASDRKRWREVVTTVVQNVLTE